MEDLYIGALEKMPEMLKQRWEKRLSQKKQRGPKRVPDA